MREYRIGRLKGRFVVSWWEDGHRRRYRLDALSRKEAEAEALDVIRRQTLPASSSTVSALWEGYQADLGDRPAGKTMGYTGIAVLEHFGALRPDQIEKRHCEEYAAKRRASGISTGSIHTELGHLRSTLTWAAKMRLIEKAPHIWRPQKPAPKDRWLTRAEIDRLLSAEAEPHVRLAIILMLATASRVGAVLELTWDRVDLDRGQINLKASAEGPRKGRATVPINGMLRAALVSAREAAVSEHVVEWAGGPVKSIRKGFMAAATRAKLTGVSPHVLRHTAAVHMAAAGVPMSQIAQYLGHSNTAVTERVYARYAPDHLRDAAAVLDFGGVRRVQGGAA